MAMWCFHNVTLHSLFKRGQHDIFKSVLWPPSGTWAGILLKKNCIVAGGIKVHSTLRPLNGLLSAPGDYNNGEIGGMIGRGNRSTRRKPARAALSTTKPTCCPYANPGRRGGKPASNRWATARPGILLVFILSYLLMRRLRPLKH
jgi:hypothetical protein